MLLEIKNLHVRAGDTQILKGVNLNVEAGEIHAIMGPNGSGKSTLANVVAGHPAYEVTEGTVRYDGDDLLELDTDKRARDGVFLAFQYPVEIPGVSNSQLMRQAYNERRKARGEDELDPLQFDDYVREKVKVVDMDPDFLDRSVNVDFSGGEKKRNEILQMAVLEPRLALLDETDSGLDIDALRVVSNGINQLAGDDNAVVLVTHYQRILDYVEPDKVHAMVDGEIVQSGGKELAMELEERGYDWVAKQKGAAQ